MFEAGGFVFTIMHDQSMRLTRMPPKFWNEPWDAWTLVSVYGSREDAKNGEKVFTVGIARCSKKDTFNKKLGRKLALAQALNNLKLTRGQRRFIWEEYFKLFRR